MSSSPKIISVSGAKSSPNLLVATQLVKTKKEKLKEFSAYRKNSTWLINNREKLRKKFGNMYVAIRNEEIYSKNKNFSKLLIDVHKKYGDSQDVYIDYVGKKKMNLLL